MTATLSRPQVRLTPQLAAVCGAVAFVVLYLIAVRTGVGRGIDNAAVRLHNLDRVAPRDEQVTRLVLDLLTVSLLPVVLWVGRHRRRPLALALGASVAASLVAEACRHLLSRPVDLRRDPLLSRSFPSGHAAFPMALCLSLLVLTEGLPWARWAGVLITSVTAGIALSFPIHRPGDLVAGFLLGVVAVSAVTPWVEPADHRGRPGAHGRVGRASFGESAARVAVGVGVILVWSRVHTFRSHLPIGALGWAFPVAVVAVCVAAEAAAGVFLAARRRQVGEPAGVGTPNVEMDETNRQAWSDQRTLRVFERSSGWSDRGEAAAVGSVAEEMRGRRILDVGVGAGRTVPLLRAISTDYRAIDFVQPMVERCRANHPDADVSWGDARSLPFEAGAFDLVVFSWNGIDAVTHEDRALVLSEVHRVLAPGGVFLYSVHNEDSDRVGEKPWTMRPRDLLHPRFVAGRVIGFPLNLRNHLRLRGEVVIGDGWSVRNAAAHHFGLLVHYTTFEAERRALADAGFEVEASFENEAGRPYPGDVDRSGVWWFHLMARKRIAG